MNSNKIRVTIEFWLGHQIHTLTTKVIEASITTDNNSDYYRAVLKTVDNIISDFYLDNGVGSILPKIDLVNDIFAFIGLPDITYQIRVFYANVDDKLETTSITHNNLLNISLEANDFESGDYLQLAWLLGLVAVNKDLLVRSYMCLCCGVTTNSYAKEIVNLLMGIPLLEPLELADEIVAICAMVDNELVLSGGKHLLNILRGNYSIETDDRVISVNDKVIDDKGGIYKFAQTK